MFIPFFLGLCARFRRPRKPIAWFPGMAGSENREPKERGVVVVEPSAGFCVFCIITFLVVFK